MLNPGEERNSIVPNHIPAEVPRIGNSVTRATGKLLLRLLGWRIEGDLPAVPKAVFAVAPHTSNWDFIIAMGTVLALGIKVSYLMKKEAFFWPFKILYIYINVSNNAKELF